MKMKTSASSLDIRITQLMSKGLMKVFMSIEVPVLLCRITVLHMFCWTLQYTLLGSQQKVAYTVVGKAQNPFGFLPTYSYTGEMP